MTDYEWAVQHRSVSGFDTGMSEATTEEAARKKLARCRSQASPCLLMRREIAPWLPVPEAVVA